MLAQLPRQRHASSGSSNVLAWDYNWCHSCACRYLVELAGEITTPSSPTALAPAAVDAAGCSDNRYAASPSPPTVLGAGAASILLHQHPSVALVASCLKRFEACGKLEPRSGIALLRLFALQSLFPRGRLLAPISTSLNFCPRSPIRPAAAMLGPQPLVLKSGCTQMRQDI